jgi:hypothetical protein
VESFMEKLVNEINVWENYLACEIIEEPPVKIDGKEIKEALKRIKSIKHQEHQDW